MNPVTTDMASALSSVATLGTDLFIGTMPDTPDQCTTLYDTGSWRESEYGIGLYHPNMQAIIRSAPNRYLAGYSLAESVRDTLLAVTPTTINSTFYGGCWCSSDILTLGQDERQRNLWSINFRVLRSG